MFSGLSVVACHCGDTEDRGLFAPQSSVPGSRSEQGSHLPYTPSNRTNLTIRKVPEWHILVVPLATEVAVRALLAVHVTVGGRRAATTPQVAVDGIRGLGRWPRGSAAGHHWDNPEVVSMKKHNEQAGGIRSCRR